MAKLKHHEPAAETKLPAPAGAETVYNPGGHVGQLHLQLEQQLSAMQMIAMQPRPVLVEPAERLVQSISRISGPIALIAASAALAYGVLAATS